MNFCETPCLRSAFEAWLIRWVFLPVVDDDEWEMDINFSSSLITKNRFHIIDESCKQKLTIKLAINIVRRRIGYK